MEVLNESSDILCYLNKIKCQKPEHTILSKSCQDEPKGLAKQHSDLMEQSWACTCG
jgi:hypothetical protein